MKHPSRSHMMNPQIHNAFLVPLLVLAHGICPLARASILTLDPLVNGDFEQSDVPSGENDELAGWTRDSTTGTVETTGQPTYANTPGVASQVAMAYVNGSESASWFYQPLTGTSGTNGATHDLTAGEAAGDTIRISTRIGIESFASWPNAHHVVRLGFQNQGSWEWQDSRDIYTGTEAQAMAAGVAADLYLGLDDALAGGDSTVWSTDFTVPATPANPGAPLVLSMNLNRAVNDTGRAVFDDFAVELIANNPNAQTATVYGGTHYNVAPDVPIDGTTEDDIFRHELYNSRIRIVFPDVAAGQVTIEFGAAELYFDQAGKRVFSIFVGGEPVESDLDLFAAAGGKNIALIRDYVVTHGGGDLTIELNASVNNAKFSYIRLRDPQGGLLNEVIARDVTEIIPIPPVESEDDLTFFNADHAPVGAYASLLYGKQGSGGIMAAAGRSDASIPSSGVLIATVQGADRKVMPFVAAGSGSTSFPTASIQRRIRAATDRWNTGDGLSWAHFSPPWTMRDLATASTAEKERFCRPSTWIEFTVDNSGGTGDRDLLFSLREPSSTPAAWGDHHGYLVSGGSLAGGSTTAIAALAADSERIDAAEVSTLLGISGANSALRFRTPAGETRTFRLIIAHYSTGQFSGNGDFTATYYYRSIFPSIAEVVISAAAGFDAARDWSDRLDGHLEASGHNVFRRFLSGHSLHSYRYSTIFLETNGGIPLWAVAEGGYAYLNTLDLTIDHLFYELAMHPWTMKNALEFFVDRYSYTDTVKSPGGTVVPGGISFTHDMGFEMAFSPAGTSAYESPARHDTFMTQEQLQNWILCASLTYTHTGDAAWLASMEGTFQQALDSMLVRDDADPAARDGITTYITTKGSHDEITTYDALDSSLKQVRDNLYIAVKSWAAYVAMDMVFSDLGDSARASQSQTAAQAAATSIVAQWNAANNYIPAIFDASNTSRIIPAIEGLVYPYRMGLYDALTTTGPYGILIQTLGDHLDGILANGTCLDATTGGWKLSSTSGNTWQSKVYLNQYIAGTILGFNDDRVEGPVDAIHADFQANHVGTAAWCDQLNSNSGTTRGSRHYPRGVTSALWWMADEVSFFEQGYGYFLRTTDTGLTSGPGGDEFRLEFLVRRSVAEAGVTIMQSPDLSPGSWTVITPPLTLLEDLGDVLRYETRIDVTGLPRYFFRIGYFAR